MSFLATILGTVGSILAGIGSQACALIIIDEPECPKSLIK